MSLLSRLPLVGRLFARTALLPLPRQPQFTNLLFLGGGELELRPIKGRRAQLEACAGWVYACVFTIAGDARSNPWDLWLRTSVRRDEWKRVEGDPLWRVLQRPNELDTWGTLLELTCIHLDLTGEAYWHVVTDRRSRPVGLQVLYPHWIDEPVIEEGRLTGWRVTVPGQSPTTLPAADVLQIRYPHPLLPLVGASPVEAFALSHSLDLYARAYGADLLRNRARPDGLLTSEQEISDAQAEAIRQRWKERYSAPGEIAILGKGATYHEISIGLKDLAFLDLARLTREQILAIYKVPPSKLGITETGATRDNARQFDTTYDENTLLPRLLRLQEAINAFVIPRFAPERAPRLYFEFVNPVKPDRAFGLQQANAMLERGAIDLDTYRDLQGLPPLPDGQGKFFLIPAGYVLVRQHADLEVRPQPQPAQPAPAPAEEPLEDDAAEPRALPEGPSAPGGRRYSGEPSPLERALRAEVRRLLSREQKAVLRRLRESGEAGESAWEEALEDFRPEWERLLPGCGITEGNRAALKALRSLGASSPPSELARAVALTYDRWKGERAKRLARAALVAKEKA